MEERETSVTGGDRLDDPEPDRSNDVEIMGLPNLRISTLRFQKNHRTDRHHDHQLVTDHSKDVKITVASVVSSVSHLVAGRRSHVKEANKMTPTDITS